MEQSPDNRANMLGRALAGIRPELDLYLMTEISLEDVAGWMGHKQFRVDSGLTHHPQRTDPIRKNREFRGFYCLA
jgi:hypothetical protein